MAVIGIANTDVKPRFWVGDRVKTVKAFGTPDSILMLGAEGDVVAVTYHGVATGEKTWADVYVRIGDTVWTLKDTDVVLVDQEDEPEPEATLEEIRDLLVEIRDAVKPKDYSNNITVNISDFDKEAVRKAAEAALYWEMKK